MSFLLLACGALLAAAFGLFAIVSRREYERRATRAGAFLAVAAPLLPVAAALAPPPVPTVATLALLVSLAGGVALWFAPVGRLVPPSGEPGRRVDERDIMFARARLQPGSHEYERYYELHPDRRASDDRTRSLSGLLSNEADLADPVLFASARPSFDITERLRDHVDGPVQSRKIELRPDAWSTRVKQCALAAGADSVGVARLHAYHVYTHVGRGQGRWGAPIALDHRTAIAFTVEMDRNAMKHAPRAPVVAESARRYAEAALIAVQLAAFLRSCGYHARAHIDGNYQVIAPLVARDAGLGEIGRMGLLMTPKLGPRVRLGVVTTTLDIAVDPPGFSAAVLDFCTVCRKCAEACPVGAIPTESRAPMDGGGLRWAIDPDICFRYWCRTGTDCGRCVTVCPYSHENNPAHNAVRWAAARSGAARRALLAADDLFYGRPRPPGATHKTDMLGPCGSA